MRCWRCDYYDVSLNGLLSLAKVMNFMPLELEPIRRLESHYFFV